ncbi:RNA polymerase factor sigma-54 [Petroclostridium sp. X23]|uniref:RNA polymerase factor sigma-54 n=1 Tax=Petroclostridium sp. X23 TaxID=3045146 RepID=UPI0024AD9C87|nr:RNA polymerase factor sigma-54 [Petroclostridium sp. X23]WHH57586.1 RNA polymerase factor sigma-54 [Petroclostridium sp. X23]
MMDMHISNNIEVTQKVVATPQLQQFVKILQMGYQELNKFIEQQSLENPVIETEPNYEDMEHYEKLKKKLEWLEDSDEENRIYHQAPEDKDDFQHTIVSNEQDSLEYHLLSQLELLSLSSAEYKIAKYLIQSLDQNGYLEMDVNEIAEIFKVNVEIVQNCLKIIQTFEPSGVGAQTLKECLLIQLKNKDIQNDQLSMLITHYLDELGKNKLHTIAKEMNITIDEVKKLYSIIKTLNPYPGNSFSSGQQVRYIKPDVIVVKFKDYYEVLLNDFAYPKMNISSYYKSMLTSANDNDTKSYISKKIEQASWIIKCIDQRNSTLLNVAKVIVEVQKKFFDVGPGHLVPMILKDVADLLSVHESTVSRTVNDKYLQCPWGIFELKYFFSSGFNNDTQADMTSENIKIVIKEIIDNENKKKPFSDQKITDLLKQKGLSIARRTVAKYREEMNIPSASGRKEF